MANDIGTGMHTYVLAQAGVKALVADRGFPGHLPEALQKYPAYAYRVISDVPENDLQGESGLSQARVQFDCYADTRSGANALAEAIRAVIAGKRGARGNEQVRTCHLENTFQDDEQPDDGSDEWRYLTTQDYLVNYVQSTA